MSKLPWECRVWCTRWFNRGRYLLAVPRVFRNWWAWPLPKLGIGVVLETRRGLRFLVRAKSTDLATLNEAMIRRPYLSSDLIMLRENSLVVDVGANIGDFSVEAAKLCPKGRIVAVEPVAEFAAMIEINKLLNNVANIEVAQVALGSIDAEVDIQLAGNASSIHWQRRGGIQRVRQTSLARLMEELGIEKIDLLKLDCEGAEWDILPNALEVLPRIEQICMEYHPLNDWSGDKLALFLRDMGFTVRLTHGGWNGMLWATRNQASAESANQLVIGL